MAARYATYTDFVDEIAAHGGEAGPEVFERVAFNMAIGNSDDHARNHTVFWDGPSMRLTPAYDLAPENRTGEATQAMAYGRAGEKRSNFAALVAVAGD